MKQKFEFGDKVRWIRDKRLKVVVTRKFEGAYIIRFKNDTENVLPARDLKRGW